MKRKNCENANHYLWVGLVSYKKNIYIVYTIYRLEIKTLISCAPACKKLSTETNAMLSICTVLKYKFTYKYSKYYIFLLIKINNMNEKEKLIYLTLELYKTFNIQH